MDVAVYRVPGGFRVSYNRKSSHASIPGNAASAVLAASVAEPLVYGAVGSVASSSEGRIVGAEHPLRMKMDCRLLARHEPRDVLEYAKGGAAEGGMAVEAYSKENWTHAPISPADDPLALALVAETEKICGERPQMYQVAGGSVAIPLRRMGIPAYGGGIISDIPGHGPDEYVDLMRLVGETILMKHLMETRL